MELRVVIQGFADPAAFPGLWVGIQSGKMPTQIQPASGESVELIATVSITPEGDFRGPMVFGLKGERFLYANWGMGEFPHCQMYGRIKVHLKTITSDLLATGGPLRIVVPGVDSKGRPACASVKPIEDWSPSR